MSRSVSLKTKARSRFAVEAVGTGAVRVQLEGLLDADGVAQVWTAMHQSMATGPKNRLELDITRVEYCDGAGMALLYSLIHSSGLDAESVTILGLRPEWERAWIRWQEQDPEASTPTLPARGHAAVDVGRAVVDLFHDLRDQVAFLGGLSLAMLHVLRHPSQVRWREVLRVFEKAGANALPIVSLISLLVGLIIAFESAQPLRLFGAEIFIVDMIGLVMVRELGPLMTAILLAGRSGSAFAAEIGTMKVNEELNALETMGLDPMRFLVIQRMLASVFLTPLLTVHAMLMGVLGGVLVMLALGFSLTLIWNQLVQSLTVGDILLGLEKSVVFGVIVAGMGCLRGLQTRQGPSAVGDSTTRAVVSSILLLILADALFSILLFVFK